MIPAYLGANSIILEIRIEIIHDLAFQLLLPCFVSGDGKSTEAYR